MPQLKIAVISDLHAYASSALKEDERRPSYLDISAPSDLPGESPYVALCALIETEALRADVLVCAGDIGDRAVPEATSAAWTMIRALKERLSASELIVTTGNHDMDSRHLYNDYDARGVLQGLEGYPSSDEAANDTYWARNVVVREFDDHRFIILNSSAYHGYEQEYTHGRVTKRTVHYLEEKLKALPTKTNILVCHHHVYRLGSVDLADYSEMKDASVLLSMIERNDFGRWLVIHGHRHWPQISYAPGPSSSPVVFSAGSLSAVLYDELQDKARNQFYTVDLDLDGPAGSVRGTFRAWDWISDKGFQPAQANSGLPARGGFGHRKGGDELAREIATLVGGARQPYLSWTDVETSIPGLKNVAPRDLDECVRLLESTYSLPVLTNRGVIVQIGQAT